MKRLTSLCSVFSLALGFALLSGPSLFAAESEMDNSATAERHLHERLAPLEGFLGTWELDAAWSSGAKLWSKAEYRPVLGGQFVEVKTWVRDGDGPVYLRYQSYLGIDAEGGVMARNFNHDGTTKNVDYKMPEPGTLVTEWSMGETSIRERYEPTSAETARWQVWMRPASGDAEWTQVMDGTWKRIEKRIDLPIDNQPATSEDSPVRPIDSNQFVAAGPDVRSIELSRDFKAPVESVYAAFTDAVAFKKAYGPQNDALAAHIDLAIGGRYEWLFDGQVGSNGCQVLSYLPNRMLSFTWNAPPTQAEQREKRTWVVVDFQESGDGTAVTLTHLGFGDGPGWDETQAYFENAWDYVLTTLKGNLDG